MSQSEEQKQRTRRLIEAARTPKGGYSRAQLAAWGVPWPPPKGWKEALVERGVPNQDGA